MNQSIEISSNIISDEQPIFIIAEAGVNHNGDIDIARQLVIEAKKAGADCIKFQTFKAERVASIQAPKAKYQLKTTNPDESQVDMLKKLELSSENHKILIEFAAKEGIVFISTPYNNEDVDYLDDLGVPAFKLASISCFEPSFLRYVAKKNKPVILSTGMAELSDVKLAVKVFREIGNHNLVLLHCTTNYPSLPEDANLLAIKTMKSTFKTLVGYSDHMQNDVGCVISASLGACVIEKHFTLDKSMSGPDQSSSATPKEFSDMVKNVRIAERSFGTGVKEPREIEKVNAIGMKRSIVTKCSIKKGQIIVDESLTLKRPGTGIPAKSYDLIIGKKTSRDIPQDHFIEMSDIEW